MDIINFPSWGTFLPALMHLECTRHYDFRRLWKAALQNTPIVGRVSLRAITGKSKVYII